MTGLGCQKRPEGHEKFIPTPDAARRAIVDVLDAWRDGKAQDDGVGPDRDVHVVDKHRRPDQRLLRYEILGEVSTDQARGFAVRLILDDPPEQPIVRFLAVGIKPMWVFRQEDFEMISHWMHPMDEGKKADQPRPEAPAATPQP